MADKRIEGFRWLINVANDRDSGHIVPMLALARQIKSHAPDSEILFLTDSEASHLIWREGFACIKLPSAAAIQEKLIEPSVAIPLGRMVAASVYAAFRPHVLVADASPRGGNGELAPLLASWAYRILICDGIPAQAIAAPDMQDDLRRYHLILVTPRSGQTASAFPPEVTVRGIGDMLIRSREEGLPRAEARRRLGLSADGFHVFLGLGDSNDDNQKDVFNRIVAKAQTMAGWSLIWPTAPLLRTPREPLADSRIRAVEYFPLGEVWRAFDGAITAMDGNIVAELMYNGVPTIFLPSREGIADDLQFRADRIEKHGAGWLLKSLDDAAFTAALAALGDPAWRATVSNNARELVPANGATAAAEYLLSHLKTIKNLGLAPPLIQKS